MTKARINSSEIRDGKVVVSWTEGINFEYDLNGKLLAAGSYDAKMLRVSETSARCTLQGVGVRS